MPDLSVITATYNAGETLADCIRSVAGQAVGVEHILVDGASTDKTMRIAEAHRDLLSIVVSEKDTGIYDAMNKGLELSSGEIVGILNADDYYASPRVLAKVREAFKDIDVGACYGDLLYVDSSDSRKTIRYWRSGSFNSRKFYWGWMPPHPTFFVRRCVYEEYGNFNLDLGSAADYEIMLRFLLKHKVKAAYIPDVLVHMRAGGVSNANLGNRLRANRMDREAWRVNGLRPYPWTLWAKPIRKIGQWFLKQ